MTLATRVSKIFVRAWQRYGEPAFAVVPPLSEWSLPVGYTSSLQHDGIETTAGDVFTDLEVLSGYFATELVYIVPTRAADDTRTMVAAGILPDGTIEVLILSGDIATVRAAFAVKLNDMWFNVMSVAAEPSGTSDVWARVRLERRQ